MTQNQQQFIQNRRVARLATADREGRPHVVAVCYAFDGQHVYIAIDDKPKRVAGHELKRVRNIRDNPHVALIIDDYQEDWSQLAYVLIQGTATILTGGTQHAQAIELLREKYPQYVTMQLGAKPTLVIQITPEQVVGWEA